MLAKNIDLSLENLKIVKLYGNLLTSMQHIVLYSIFMLILLFLVIIILTSLKINKTKFKIVFDLIKTLMLIFLFLVTCITLFKFTLELWIYYTYKFYISKYTIRPFRINFYFFNKLIFLNSSNLGDVIILLAFSSGSVCLYRLGKENVNKHFTNISLFSMIIVSVVFMVYTNNILMMFVNFEILFLSAAYFIYNRGYIEETDKTLEFFLCWILSGTFLILLSLSYIFIKYKTLNFLDLRLIKFSLTERFFLSFFIFLSFSLRMPVYPLYKWLLKVHTKAPISFSIFFNGFLLKTVTYCLYYFNLIIKCEILIIVVCALLGIGVADAGFKFWSQTNLRKLITFVTIQEMSIILFLTLNLGNTINYCLVLYMLGHSLVVILMFCLVDVIEKKTQSSNIETVIGLEEYFTELEIFIWIIIFSVSGFPFSLKFFLMIQAFAIILPPNDAWFLFIVFFLTCVSNAGFVDQLGYIYFGYATSNKKTDYTLSNKEIYLFFFISFIVVALNIFNYWIVLSLG